jgi:putative Ca2+/H+ antiporter (TMEM165/GDT1 family)
VGGGGGGGETVSFFTFEYVLNGVVFIAYAQAKTVSKKKKKKEENQTSKEEAQVGVTSTVMSIYSHLLTVLAI